jgi:hypothetical protein
MLKKSDGKKRRENYLMIIETSQKENNKRVNKIGYAVKCVIHFKSKRCDDLFGGHF